MSHLDRDLMKAYGRRRSRQLNVAVSVLLVVSALILFGNRAPSRLAGVLTHLTPPVLAGALFVFTLLNWRCPQCNSFLGLRSHQQFCARCGARLRSGLKRS